MTQTAGTQDSLAAGIEQQSANLGREAITHTKLERSGERVAAMARAPRRVVDLAAAGRLQAITSWELLPELEDVLARGLRRSAEAGDPILREVLSYAEVIAPTEEIEVSMCDPADVKVITGALVGRADFIVTGDADLLDLGQVGAVRIIGVAAFLDGRL